MASLESVFFFFSSRRRHTRCSRDWSSDVCSSDLVIKLRGGLVVPTAPGLAAIHADDCALVTGERDNPWILRTNPDALVIVSPWRSLETHKRLPSVGGFPGGRIRNVNNVGFVRRNRDSHRPRTAAPNPMIRVDEPPGFAGVIRNVHAAIFVGFHRDRKSVV